MKKFLSSLLIALTVIVAAAPAFADECNLYTTENSSVCWFDTSGTCQSTNSSYVATDYISVQPSTDYTVYAHLSGAIAGHGIRIVFYDSNKTFISPRMGGDAGTGGDYVYNITSPSNARYVRVSTASAAQGVNPVIVVKGTYTKNNIPTNLPQCGAACPNGGTPQTYTSATGTVVQNGTPTPTNPIEPVFYTQGNMVLRKVGDYADSYDSTTGKITRRIGVKVLDGTEDFTYGNPLASMFNLKDIQTLVYASDRSVYSTHFKTSVTLPTQSERNGFIERSSEGKIGIGYLLANGSVDTFKSWVAEQYAAGTPVTIYYPLATPVEEDWAPEQCTSSSPIKIATTAYNTARFSPVMTDLNTTIATIRDIVTNTINQTAAIASLQADKQTRPEDACPAGKKCLLVETEENGVIVPHWFPIIETPEE